MFGTHGKGRAGSFAAAVPWHGCWELARWAATRHGFAIDPHSVVVRTRPDFRFKESLDLAPLERVFRQGTDDGLDGAHLSISSLGASDVFALTSFVAYETDVALPIRVGMATGGDMGRMLVEIGLTNGWQQGVLKWEQRLRPPMTYMVEGLWLGTIVRAQQLALADQPAYFAHIREKEWPVRRVDVTKGVHLLLPPNAPKQPDGLWSPELWAGVPRYNKKDLMYAKGLGTRRTFQPHNLTDWVSPAEDGRPRAEGAALCLLGAQNCKPPPWAPGSNELRCERACNAF